MAPIRFVLLFVLLAAAAGAANKAVALDPSEQDYIFDIAKKNPKLLQAWQWIVPRTYRNQEWLTDLTKATSTPVNRMLIAGKRFILGQACWPHNCGGNEVIFLIAADGSEAYGLLASQDLQSPETFFGSPDAQKKDMLRNTLKAGD